MASHPHHKHRVWLKNASQIVHVTKDPSVHVLVGYAQNLVDVTTAVEGDALSLVVDADGNIADFGADSVLSQKYSDAEFEHVHDVQGAVLMPGFVDAHTHPVFAGDRVNEFEMKLRGATYMEIHAAGGGIHSTVEATRSASLHDLSTSLAKIAVNMLKKGTTTVEAKSGYGLDSQTEIKMLQAIHEVNKTSPLEFSPTFCGAHAVPKGTDAEAATTNVCEVQIPELKKHIADHGTHVENVDVFCEKGVFSVDQTRRICQKAVEQLKLNINFHGDELHPTKSAELAAELKAMACSHLEEASDEGIAAMAESGTVAVILPSTAYILKLKPPPVRKMIQAGVPVALGSDFNPNAYCYSMPMTMHLGCCICGMSLTESLVAATLNAAASIGRGGTHGALAIGRKADIVVCRVPTWQHLVYRFGCHDDVIEAVLKEGRLVSGKLA